MKKRLPSLLYRGLLITLTFLFAINLFNYGTYFLFFLALIIMLKAAFTFEIKYDFGLVIAFLASALILTMSIVHSGFSLQNLTWSFMSPLGGYIAARSVMTTFARDRNRTFLWALFAIVFSAFSYGLMNYIYSAVVAGSISPDSYTNIWNGSAISRSAIVGCLALPLFLGIASSAYFVKKRVSIVALILSLALSAVAIGFIAVIGFTTIWPYIILGLALIAQGGSIIFHRSSNRSIVPVCLSLVSIIGAIAVSIAAYYPLALTFLSSLSPFKNLLIGTGASTLPFTNLLLNSLEAFGLVGLLPIAMIFVYLIVRLVRYLKRPSPIEQIIALASSLALLSYWASAFNILVNAILLPLFFFAFGLAKYALSPANYQRVAVAKIASSKTRILLVKVDERALFDERYVYRAESIRGYDLSSPESAGYSIFDSGGSIPSALGEGIAAYDVIVFDESVRAKERAKIIRLSHGQIAFLCDAHGAKSKMWSYGPRGFLYLYFAILRFARAARCTIFVPHGHDERSLSVALLPGMVVTLPAHFKSSDHGYVLKEMQEHYCDEGGEGDTLPPSMAASALPDSAPKVKKERTSSLKYGAIISYLLVVVNIVAGLFYTPWMINELGKTDYGIYSLALSIIAIFSFDFGLGYAITKYVAHYKSIGDSEKADNLMGIIYKMYLIISAIIFAALLGIYFFLPSLYQSFSSDELDKLKIVYIIVGFFAVISFTFMPQQGLIVGNDKYPQSKLIELGQKIVNIAAIIIVLLLDGGLYLFVAVTCAVSLATILVKTIFIRRTRMFGSKPNFKFRDSSMLKMVLATSIWTAVIGIGQRLTLSIQPAVIGIFSGPDPVAVFALAVTIETYAYTFSNATEGMFMPRLSKMASSNASVASFEGEAIKIGRINLLIFGLLFVGIVSLGQGFISIWTRSSANNDFSQSYYVLILILFPFLSVNTQIIGKYLMLVKDKMRYVAYSSIATAIITTLISLLLSWLAPEYGAIFAGVGICVGQLIGWAVMNNIFFHKHLGFNIRHIVFECQVKLLPLLALSIAFGFGVEYLIPSTSWPLFLIKVVLVASFYALMSWNVFTKKEEKAIISSIAANLSKRLGALDER